jgi:hypothetical protein
MVEYKITDVQINLIIRRMGALALGKRRPYYANPS